MSPNGIIDLNSLTAFRSQRFDDQVSSNPFFFNGPFTGVLVQPAAYTFIYRFMANHSVESPHGELRSEVLQSWFGVEEEEEGGEYVWREGWERIPLNWVSTLPTSFDSYLPYPCKPLLPVCSNMRKKTVQTSHRIPLRQRLFPRRCRQRCSSPSQIPQYWRVSSHLPNHLLPSSSPTNQPTTNPRPPLFFFFSSHRNTNGPNTFTGLNITSFTSGIFPAENFFTKKDGFACFAYQFAAQAKPDLLGALDVVTGQIPSLTSQVKALMGELEGCSQLREVDEELLMQFQGYRRSKGEGIVKRL